MYQRICVKYSNLFEEVYKRFRLAEEIWIPVVLKFDKKNIELQCNFLQALKLDIKSHFQLEYLSQICLLF